MEFYKCKKKKRRHDNKAEDLKWQNVRIQGFRKTGIL